MSIVDVHNEEELDRLLAPHNKAVVIGFFGSFSKASGEAEESFRKFSEENPEETIVFVDVGKVKGLHKRFGVSSVPTVVSVTEQGEVVQKVLGVQDPSYYERAFFEQSLLHQGDGEDKPRFPPVTVWVSDTCSWCTRVKTYLRKNRVPFREVNVSRDPSAASSLTAKTGQTGVPQLDIGGSYIVGFNKPRIDELLGLPAGARN